MSDLYCPATVILARHGEAEYESTLVADAGGCLTREGRRHALELGETLLPRRIAIIYTSSMSRAVQTAEIAATVLAAPVRVREGLREFGVGDLAGQPFATTVFDPVVKAWRQGDLTVGCPGAETGADVVHRVVGVLESIADEHRGEAALVVGHSGSLQLTASALVPSVGDIWTAERSLSYGATAELEADADGWRCVSWPGESP